MNNIAQHIEKLIVKHNCVIVPGLGGFLISRESAAVADSALHAPMMQIRFNNLLSHQDGLLAEQYMKERGLSYEEANSAIASEVAIIHSGLRTTGHYSLGRIGTLRAEASGAVVFHNQAATFLPDNLGLPTVHLTPLKREAAAEIRRTYSLGIPRQAARYAAMLAFVFIFSLIIPTPTSNTGNQAGLSFDTLKSAAEFLTKTDTAADASGTIPPIEDEGEEALPATSGAATQKTRRADCQTMTAQPYQLIIASLTSRRQAEQYIAEQQSFAADELEIIECGGRFRVSAGGFHTLSEANSHADSIRSTVAGTENAWILKNQ